MSKIVIVAEIGCNHNGDYQIARKMVLKAKECGVDGVKFQTFNSEALISRFAPKADYQKVTTGTSTTQLEMTKKLELKGEDYLKLKEYALNLGLVVFSTPFDLDSIDFLYKNGQNIWKIPSGELTNLPYLEKIGSLKYENKNIILSTGMATIEEIKTAINVLIKNGTKESEITLLHCTTQYPAEDNEINLGAINDLKNNFPNFKIGFSDHSKGYIAAIGAAAIGVCMIEKHFTLDKNMQGPDHKASINPEELILLCENVRRIEKMLGCGKKVVTESEEKNKIAARKSIVAKCDIKKGEILTTKNITVKRPGNGISPMKWYEILGKKAEKDFKEDELITVEGL